jgi:GrpB-like predicted nucleotidyltransferase (UPF0157 family)
MTGSTGQDNRATRTVEQTEQHLRASTIGEPVRLNGKIRLVDYDPAWPEQFASEAGKIRAALGVGALSVEHAGSTSVPGLAAKPIIDIVLVVADSADEPSYIPALEAAGYVLRNREPEWLEHRMLKSVDPDVHMHVFSAGCPEVARMLAFRDWLRANAADRALYERTKRELVQRDWAYMQSYADAKTEVVEAILARAVSAQPAP